MPSSATSVPARALKRLERVGLSTTAIQRHHLLGPKALVQGMLCDERLELGDQLNVATASQVRVNRALQRRQPELVKTRRDRPRAWLVGEIRKRGPAPQLQRSAELHRGNAKASLVERPRARARPTLEDPQVERALRHRRDIAAPPGSNRITAQSLAQLGDIRLKHVPSGDRWLLGPDLVHKPRDGHNLVSVHE